MLTFMLTCKPQYMMQIETFLLYATGLFAYERQKSILIFLLILLTNLGTAWSCLITSLSLYANASVSVYSGFITLDKPASLKGNILALNSQDNKQYEVFVFNGCPVLFECT